MHETTSETKHRMFMKKASFSSKASNTQLSLNPIVAAIPITPWFYIRIIIIYDDVFLTALVVIHKDKLHLRCWTKLRKCNFSILPHLLLVQAPNYMYKHILFAWSSNSFWSRMCFICFEQLWVELSGDYSSWKAC